MNSAAKRVTGRSNSASGAPLCSMRPLRMRITRSLMVSASSWLCVM
jgi:hypothetical protein